MKPNNITSLVKGILEGFPETREDDYLLWLRVMQFSDFPTDMNILIFLETAKYMKYPHYETVSRVRRKLQGAYPELKATAETRAARAKLEEQYREYARTNV